MCPRCCTKELEEGKYTCPNCNLEFKNKNDAKRISIIYPGGGYFYTGHPVLGVCDAISEIALIIFVIVSFFDGSHGALTVFAISLIFEKISTVYHSNQYIKEYIPICDHRKGEQDDCSICKHKKGNFVVNYILLPIAAMCALFSTLIFTNVITTPYFHFNASFGGRIYEVTKASPNLPVPRSPVESLDINQFIELRKMLDNKQFDKLTTALEKYQVALEADYTDYKNEYKLYDAYNAIDVYTTPYEQLLKEWIAKFPDRHPPYLVLGKYYESQGWKSRGSKWAKDTSEEEFDNMRMYFTRAKENLNTALEINPKLFIAYDTLLGMCKAYSLGPEEDRIVECVLELYPYSIIIRNTYMRVKIPRWGGSYIIMENFAKEAEKYTDINPKLAILYGTIYRDQAELFILDEKYIEAVDLLTKALAFGDFWSTYYTRATIYHFKLNEQDKALEDINHSIALRPIYDVNYQQRSRIYFAKGEMDKSLEDLRTAILLGPDASDTLIWKAEASNALVAAGHNLQGHDLLKTIEKYDLALKFNPENESAWSNRGVALHSLQRHEEALESYNKATNLKPDFIEAWDNKGITLAKLGKHDEAIKCHDKAIELSPGFSHAWYNKACTYAQMQDKEKCIANLQKAIELAPKFKAWAAKDKDFKALWDDEDFKRIVN